jgi:predicted dehydrogenase
LGYFDRLFLLCSVPDGMITIGLRHDRSIKEFMVPKDQRIAHLGFHFSASYIEHLEFLSAIKQGTPPTVSTRDGLASVAIGIATHQSMDEQRLVYMHEVFS